MSDQKAQPKPPANDRPPEQPKAPLKEVQVDVRARAKDGKSQKYANKVRDNLKADVEKAVADAAPKGAAEQFKAAEKVVHEKAELVDPKQVRQISVDVSGRVGGSGRRVGDETVATPGKPPPPAATPTLPAPAPKGGPAKKK